MGEYTDFPFHHSLCLIERAYIGQNNRPAPTEPDNVIFHTIALPNAHDVVDLGLFESEQCVSLGRLNPLADCELSVRNRMTVTNVGLYLDRGLIRSLF